MVYAHKLGIAKLNNVQKLPWYPADSDKTTWPRIPGTEETVLRFRWDESWEHDDNFYSIRMIVSHIKHHGPHFMPAAELALLTISEDDFQWVVNKFLGLQKGLRQARILNSNNKHIVVEVVGDEETSCIEGQGSHVIGVAPAERKPNRASMLMSCAKGVCVEKLHFCFQNLITTAEVGGQEKEV